jgi:hypothetical protein
MHPVNVNLSRRARADLAGFPNHGLIQDILHVSMLGRDRTACHQVTNQLGSRSSAAVLNDTGSIDDGDDHVDDASVSSAGRLASRTVASFAVVSLRLISPSHALPRRYST